MTDESAEEVEVSHIMLDNGNWYGKLGDSGKRFVIVHAAKSFPNHVQQAKRDRGQWVNVEAGAEWVVSKIAFKQGAHKATCQLIYKGFEGQPYDVLDGKLAQNLRFWADEAALRPGNYVTVLPVVEVCVDAEGLWWACKAQKTTGGENHIRSLSPFARAHASARCVQHVNHWCVACVRFQSSAKHAEIMCKHDLIVKVQ